MINPDNDGSKKVSASSLSFVPAHSSLPEYSDEAWLKAALDAGMPLDEYKEVFRTQQRFRAGEMQAAETFVAYKTTLIAVLAENPGLKDELSAAVSASVALIKSQCTLVTKSQLKVGLKKFKNKIIFRDDALAGQLNNIISAEFVPSSDEATAKCTEHLMALAKQDPLTNAYLTAYLGANIANYPITTVQQDAESLINDIAP
jgi:hypothetical protein